MRRSVYQNRIAPKDVQQHFLINASLFKTSASIRNAIEDFCEAKDEQDQSTGSHGAFINAIQGKRPRSDDKPPVERGNPYQMKQKQILT